MLEDINRTSWIPTQGIGEDEEIQAIGGGSSNIGGSQDGITKI